MKQVQNDVPALRVVELFAGVGGFRHGLTTALKDDSTPRFDVVWSNQFEPGCKQQHAASVYRSRWGDKGFVNRDINEVLVDVKTMEDLSDLRPDMLVGGFPCQDYSVARPSNQSAGLQGKKGVLWWSIFQMLQARHDADRPFAYLMFENVDRLVNSPSTCRGRDFAVILSSLQSLGYAVEWRVVNSADYGFPQKRKRIFILAYHNSTKAFTQICSKSLAPDSLTWLTEDSPVSKALPARFKPGKKATSFNLSADILAAQENYAEENGRSRFQSAGICVNGRVITAPLIAQELTNFEPYVGQARTMTLGDITSATCDVPEQYFLPPDQVPRWEYAKGAKAIDRVSKTGFAYTFTEGALAFPDHLDKPSRTIITSEGGRSASRTSHVVTDVDGRLRRLTPEELEALTGFTRGFTAVPGIPPARRAFLMGNALVTGIVRVLGAALSELHIRNNLPDFDQ